ncbi:hypothetical protein BDF22DRAFT_664475, partial [Syncephalis plumigaleata]
MEAHVPASVLSTRVVYIDHYNAAPTEYDLPAMFGHGNDRFVKISPLIRVFGTTSSGQKACVHVHQALPYFYINCNELLKASTASDYCDHLGMALESAIATSYGHDIVAIDDNYRMKYVGGVLPVRGIPFYGYHPEHVLLMKIYLLLPNSLEKATNLLASGMVMGTKFHIYEAHIPFTLQFMADFNIYGMGWIHMGRIRSRKRSQNKDNADNGSTIFEEGTEQSVVKPLSYCEIEVDIIASDIINYYSLRQNNLATVVYTDESQRDSNSIEGVYLPSLKEIWENEATRRAKYNLTGVELSLSQIGASDTSSYRTDNNEENISILQRRILLDETASSIQQAEDSVQNDISWAMTTFKAITGLFKGKQPVYRETSLSMSSLVSTKTASLDESTTALPRQGSNKQDDREHPSEELTEARIDMESMLNPSRLLGCNRHSKLNMRYKIPPPSTKRLQETLAEYGLPEEVHYAPTYNEIGNYSRTKRLGSIYIKQDLQGSTIRRWRPALDPPAARSLSMEAEVKSTFVQTSEHASQPFTSMKDVNTSVQSRFENLAVISLEILAESRGELLPNPEMDAIIAIFYCYKLWNTDLEHDYHAKPIYGIVTSCRNIRQVLCGRKVDYTFVEESEDAVIRRFAKCIQLCDPDILIGYELHHCSWNYIAKRAQEAYDMPFCSMIGRVMASSNSVDRDMSRWKSTRSPELYVPGRHVINVWKIMRTELSVTDYSFENIVFEVLRIRIPKFENSILHKWFIGDSMLHRWRAISHFFNHITYKLELLEARQVIETTSEFARVFGVDFMSILTRGSQFKVESLLLRVAKLSNYVLLSPTRKEVAGQRALEYIPLVMEPYEGYYKDPTLVLDFRSLYPSLIIAYNICYSTCLGNLWRNELGVLPYQVPVGQFAALRDKLHVAPNGAVFLDTSARRSLFSQMLHELLVTRAMVKESIKLYEGYDKTPSFLKLLKVRDSGLKFIANVMYGYMSASYSGRMPCVDLADAIVSYGRNLLEGTINWINEIEPSPARVVYGDTDSIFVNVEGVSVDRAFQIGNSIAQSITSMHPRPVQLKLEKVYMPCVLLSKKRYVGFSYNSPEDRPIYDAKGIETVRRDYCGATSRILKEALSLLFDEQNLSKVKDYLLEQFSMLLQGRVLLTDLIIAKEVRLDQREYSHVTPGVAVCTRRMKTDPQTRPQYGERVPYIIVYNERYTNLADMAVSPQEFVQQNLRFNADYYITKQIIPPLNRIFNLMDIDVTTWYNSMPRKIVYSHGIMYDQVNRHANRGNVLILLIPVSNHLVIL